MQINSQVPTAQDFDDIVYNARKDYLLIVMGQSNTASGEEVGVAPVATGGIDRDIKLINVNGYMLDAPNVDTVLTARTMGEGLMQSGNVVKLGYMFTLAKRIKATLPDGAILTVVNISQGETGFNAGHWSANGLLATTARRVIDNLVGARRYTPVGICFSQGERDSNILPNAEVYPAYLYNFLSFIRSTLFQSGVDNAFDVPIAVLPMVPEWVGAVAARVAVQSVLQTVRQNVPFSASADVTGLPTKVGLNTVHYDYRQNVELGNRVFDALQSAGTDASVGATVPNGEYLISRQLAPAIWGGIRDALSVTNATTETDSLFTRIHEMHKYKCDRGVFKYRLLFTVDGVERGFEFEQTTNAMFTSVKDAQASITTLINNPVWGGAVNSGFSGLYFTQNANTLLQATSDPANWWLPVGAVALLDGGYPAVDQVAFGHATRHATEIKLYAIKD